MISVIRNEETGNSLVNCAACLSVQTQVDNWSCDVNCKVVNSENGKWWRNLVKKEYVMITLINHLK